MASKYSDNGREYIAHKSTSVTRVVAVISALIVGIGVIALLNPVGSTGSIILAVLAGGTAFFVVLCLCNVYLNMSDDIKRMSDIIDELDQKVSYQNNMLGDLLSKEQTDRRKMYKTQIQFYNDSIRSLKDIQEEVHRLNKNRTPGAFSFDNPETGYSGTDHQERSDHNGYAEPGEVKAEEDGNETMNGDPEYKMDYEEDSSDDQAGKSTLDIEQVRDILAVAADKPITRERLEAFCWGEYKKIPDSEGVIWWENGWYDWNTGGHAESSFRGPIPEDELIGYLAACMGIDIGPRKLESKRFYELINLPCYRSLEEISEHVRHEG